MYCFATLCRLCKQTSNYPLISFADNEGLTLNNLFSCLPNIKNSELNLKLTSICRTCHHKINDILQFQFDIDKSDVEFLLYNRLLKSKSTTGQFGQLNLSLVDFRFPVVKIEENHKENEYETNSDKVAELEFVDVKEIGINFNEEEETRNVKTDNVYEYVNDFNINMDHNYSAKYHEENDIHFEYDQSEECEINIDDDETEEYQHFMLRNEDATSSQTYINKFCNKQFKISNHFLQHETVHIAEKCYQCQTCGMTFRHPLYLKKHQRLHVAKRPFKCKYCSKKFVTLSELKKHELIHTDEIPFECKHCHKKFSRRYSLTRHWRIHTGEKPYECIVCNVKFRERSHLNKHKRIHHPTIKNL